MCVPIWKRNGDRLRLLHCDGRVVFVPQPLEDFKSALLVGLYIHVHAYIHSYV